MSAELLPPVQAPLVYPERDGRPMSDNTKQARWIVFFYDNLKGLFRSRPDVFVAADLRWYPEEGEREVPAAPDVMVVFGRPPGDRGSYKQWEEAGVPVTVAFEILSPGNDPFEMSDKLAFYTEYGVEEYYLYDPDSNRLQAYLRRGTALLRVRQVNGFVSPRMGVRFDTTGPELVVVGPDGEPFLSFEALMTQRDNARQRADLEAQRADLAEKRADLAERRLARLRLLGRKARRREATEEELRELERLETEEP